jgi:hypothetical protein
MTPKSITENALFYGDNLPILREYVPDESVDLVYLDLPFNSQRTYNVLFKDESGLESDARDMETEATAAGFYHSPVWQRDYARLQLLTVEQLLAGARVEMPPDYGTFKRVERVVQVEEVQGRLEL